MSLHCDSVPHQTFKHFFDKCHKTSTNFSNVILKVIRELLLQHVAQHKSNKRERQHDLSMRSCFNGLCTAQAQRRTW